MKKSLVLQTDFGLSDGAVSAMYGVSLSVDPDLKVFDLTHDIPAFDIWEASYRLYQTISYWPEGTVFVSVVDPGVGSGRKSIVAQTMGNHYIVTPDNGTLTHVNKYIGIREVREIDERINRLPNSGESYTFHGRDVYAYTGARLASGAISFYGVGASHPHDRIVSLPLQTAQLDNGVIQGSIDVLDIRFGNLWTNVSRELFSQLDATHGDGLEVTIDNGTRQTYRNSMIFGKSFADRHIGEPILYVNSLDNLGIAINQGSFADAYHIQPGPNWTVTVRKASHNNFN